MASRQGVGGIFEIAGKRRGSVCAHGIYIYAKKTIKFSHIGKDCASFRATSARLGVIYITIANIIDAPLKRAEEPRRKPSFSIAEFLSAKAGRVTNDNNDTDKEST